MSPVGEYLLAFSLTLAIELPAYLLGLAALHRLGRSSVDRRRIARGPAVLLVLVVNLVTHPLLWWLFGSGAGWTRGPAALPLAEAGAALVEGLILYAALRRDLGWLLLIAAGANATSYATGLFIQIASSGP